MKKFLKPFIYVFGGFISLLVVLSMCNSPKELSEEQKVQQHLDSVKQAQNQALQAEKDALENQKQWAKDSAKREAEASVAAKENEMEYLAASPKEFQSISPKINIDWSFTPTGKEWKSKHWWNVGFIEGKVKNTSDKSLRNIALSVDLMYYGIIKDTIKALGANKNAQIAFGSVGGSRMTDRDKVVATKIEYFEVGK